MREDKFIMKIETREINQGLDLNVCGKANPYVEKLTNITESGWKPVPSLKPGIQSHRYSSMLLVANALL